MLVVAISDAARIIGWPSRKFGTLRNAAYVPVHRLREPGLGNRNKGACELEALIAFLDRILPDGLPIDRAEALAAAARPL